MKTSLIKLSRASFQKLAKNLNSQLIYKLENNLTEIYPDAKIYLWHWKYGFCQLVDGQSSLGYRILETISNNTNASRNQIPEFSHIGYFFEGTKTLHYSRLKIDYVKQWNNGD